MIHPTDRLFLRNRESRQQARVWAEFIMREVDALSIAGIPVASALFQRDDFSYRLTDRDYCLRQGVVNIPGEIDLHTLIEASLCEISPNSADGINFAKEARYKEFSGVPKEATLRNYGKKAEHAFGIIYQVGEFPEAYDGWSKKAKWFDILIFPSIASIYKNPYFRH